MKPNDEERMFYIDPNYIKQQVLNKSNDNNLIFDSKKYSDEKVEMNKLPLFTPFLYNMIYSNGKIPLFIDFLKEYCNAYELNLNNALKLRLSKSYVSAIRELYIRCFLKKEGIEVRYNVTDDISNDVDMWVLNSNNEWVAVALYVDSEYSRQNREHKVIKRFKNVEYIDFGYEMNNENRKDCVYFPYDEDLNKLINIIKNGN